MDYLHNQSLKKECWYELYVMFKYKAHACKLKEQKRVCLDNLVFMGLQSIWQVPFRFQMLHKRLELYYQSARGN